MNMLPHCAALLICSAFITQAHAENSTRAGEYTIHHNAVTTDTLTAEIAKNYGITRSPNRGLINIAVIRDVAGATGTPVTAQVQVRAHRLSGQQEEIYLREIREQKAIYYIGTFGILNGEKIRFRIFAQPTGHGQRHEMQMEQEFFSP